MLTSNNFVAISEPQQVSSGAYVIPILCPSYSGNRNSDSCGSFLQ